jgi:dihydrofolate synthase/folylpolyglutamate synthase
MTYAESIQFLYNLRFFGAKFGLENSLKLADLAGNPQQSLRFIHVAGTNGKGSTCAMLESIYRAAGLRVGLFTSPHLVAFGERIQVNRQLVPESEVVRLAADFQRLLSYFPANAHPTFFEVVTVMALRYFAEQECELVVWETGLGGRLDATNIVTPLASVITNVQFDHQQWLGETVPLIAAEKAGIIKPRVPVITAAEDPLALEVITQVACSRQAPLTIVSPDDFLTPLLQELALPLRGQHQRMNAALALATVRALREQISVPAAAIRSGLEHVEWAGRLQLLKTSSGQSLLLDGAHNPAGAKTLRAAFREYFPDTSPALILGFMRDKDWAAMCGILAPLGSRILLVPVSSERSADPEALRGICQEANPTAEIRVCASLVEALGHTVDAPFVVLAGSLYLVGETLELLQVSTAQRVSERGLNEWTSSPALPLAGSARNR